MPIHDPRTPMLAEISARTQTLERPKTRGVGVAEAEVAPPERIQEDAQPLGQRQRAAEGEYDVAILGSGPGGYVAAIRAAQLGLRTAIVERGYLGGTCLNVGCIPTKAMLGSVEALHIARRGKEFGFDAPTVTPNYPKMVERRNKIVDQLRGGVGQLMRSHKITVVQGTGRLTRAHELAVSRNGTTEPLHARNIIIATGSVPARPPIPGSDAPGVVTSDDLLNLPEIPASMVVIGAGAVGLEWGDIFNGLGTQVTVIEMLDQVLPAADADIAAAMARILNKKGMRVHTSARVQEIVPGKDGLTVRFTKDDKDQDVTAAVVLIATGRRAYTGEIGLDSIGIELQRGAIPVDDRMQTRVPGVYAIGDCVGGYLLAHVASREGEVAAENIAGQSSRIDYRAVPNCVYTSPEIAMVGLTEAEARERHEIVRVGSFPFRILGKALAIGEREGFVKVISEDRYGEILGVHMIGAHVTDMIAEAALAIQMEGTVEDLIHTIHAHPTMPEALLEASLDVLGRSIHKG
jgi:dihydrolipoamide dehydrogenase